MEQALHEARLAMQYTAGSSGGSFDILGVDPQESALAEDQELMQRCLHAWRTVEPEARVAQVAKAQVELMVQMRQLASWASEGQALRQRVTFLLWRGLTMRGKRLQGLNLACALLARRLDKLVVQMLFVRWQSTATPGPSRTADPEQSEPAPTRRFGMQEAGRFHGSRAAMNGPGTEENGRLTGRLALLNGTPGRPFRGPVAAELLAGFGPNAASAVARPSTWRRALRRAEAAVRLLDRVTARRRIFAAWLLATIHSEETGAARQDDKVDRPVSTQCFRSSAALLRDAALAWRLAASVAGTAAAVRSELFVLRAALTIWCDCMRR